MKRATLALVAAFAAIVATAETSRTATENWTRNRIAEATNATLQAAKDYTDEHGGGSSMKTNAVIDIANATIATNPVVAAKANEADIPQIAKDAMSAEGIASGGINIGGNISGMTVSDQSGDLRNGINAKADRAVVGVADEIATLDANGNPTRSGIRAERVVFTDAGGEAFVIGEFAAEDGSGTVHRLTHKANRSMISATDETFSNAVLAVGLNIDTNSVAVLNEIAATFGDFPVTGTATTVGGLLAALAAAVAWLRKRAAHLDNNGFGDADFAADLLGKRVAKDAIIYKANTATGLKDRAFNALSLDGTEYNLSTALSAVTPTVSGQPRDLLIVATATAQTTISYTAGTIKGDKPTIDGAGTWLITLTEYASGVWYCRQIKMEDAQ